MMYGIWVVMMHVVGIVGNVTTLTLNANMELTYSVTVAMSMVTRLKCVRYARFISPKKSFRKTKNIYRIVCYMFIDFMDFTFHASNVQKIYIKMRCRFLFLTLIYSVTVAMSMVTRLKCVRYTRYMAMVIVL
jgi:hypothetical protein